MRASDFFTNRNLFAPFRVRQASGCQHLFSDVINIEKAITGVAPVRARRLKQIFFGARDSTKLNREMVAGAIDFCIDETNSVIEIPK